MSNRETQYPSVAACRFEPKKIETDTWQLLDAEAEDGHPCVVSNGSIRLQPSKRWSEDVHFHPDLCIKTSSTTSTSTSSSSIICCQWQAMAHECVAVVLSPDQAAYVPGRTYEVCFGAAGNTRTALRRGKNHQHKVTVPSLVCTERAWTSYWACLVVDEATSRSSCANENTFFYVGVGEIPGMQCVAILQVQDTAEDSKEGAKESKAGEENDDDPPPPQASPPKYYYAGFGNRAVPDRQAPVPLQVRNICLTAITVNANDDDDAKNTAHDSLKQTLKGLTRDSLDLVYVGELDEETQKMVDAYQQETRKARARAAKFGIAYKEPPANVFLPWSKQRKMRANPKTGFQTGMDLSDPAEKAKQEARRQRFGVVAMEAETETAEESTSGLPVNQAWDNEELVQKMRSDPPKLLWTIPPPDAVDDGMAEDEFRSEAEEPPTMTPEKIHIFSIDWSAFKQIRTNDIMSYFSIYGPKYVEWLGDLSCNVEFEDRYSAFRALENMSDELPTPVPEDLPPPRGEDPPPRADLGAMGWRLGKKLLRKVKSDRYGQRGTTARMLMRVATSRDILQERPSSWPKPPPGFTTKRVLGPNSDFPKRRQQGNSKRQRHDDPRVPTFDPSIPGSEHPLMQSSLSSGREGFSVKEMEAERAKKRAKKQSEGEQATGGP